MAFHYMRSTLYEPLSRFGVKCGISPKLKRKLKKFQNQTWLVLFYSISTLFGIAALHSYDFFRFPLWSSDSDAVLTLYDNHPQEPDWTLLLYYNYEIGFYFTEVMSLFIYGKRADFVEMALHHASTLFLLVFSHMARYHRIGAYVLLIHDASDVMLSVSKSLVYTTLPEFWTFTAFSLFISSFVFFRLICLPVLGIADFSVGPRMIPYTPMYWVLMYTAHIVLQSLHLYWFGLIIRLVHRIVTKKNDDPRTTDIRSSDEEAELTHSS